MSDIPTATTRPESRRDRRRRIVCIAIIIVLAVAATWTLLSITRSGIGLGRDSRAYLRLTRIIRSSGVPGSVDPATGQTTVETHFPPGYPLLLSRVAESFDVTPAMGGRAINAVAIGLSILLVGALGAYATRRPARGVLAALLFGIAAGTWGTHLFLLTEASFGTLMLAAFLLSAVHARRGGWGWLCAAALCAGLGVVVRYAGVAMVLAGLLALLIGPRRVRWQGRLLEAAVFGAIALCPLAIWVGWYTRHTGTAAAARPDVQFTPLHWDRFADALTTMGEWIGGGERQIGAAAAIIGGGVLLAILALVVFTLWPSRPRATTDGTLRERDRATIPLPLAYLIVCPLFLLVSTSFFDSATPFDQRILYPLHVSAIVVFVGVVPLTRRWSQCAVALLVVAQAFACGSYLRDAREHHLGYNSMEWQREPVIRFIRNLPRGATIVTDNVEVVELAAERTSVQLPRVDGLPDPGDRTIHKLAMADLRQRVPDGSYLVLIDRNRRDRRYTPLSRLARAFQLTPLHDYPTGPVFRIERPDLRPSTRPATKPAKRPKPKR